MAIALEAHDALPRAAVERSGGRGGGVRSLLDGAIPDRCGVWLRAGSDNLPTRTQPMVDGQAERQRDLDHLPAGGRGASVTEPRAIHCPA